MKKIGRGWQYTAYEIGNGRIRKIFNTRTEAYLVFLRDCFPYTKFPLWQFSKTHKSMVEKAEKSLSWIKYTTLDLSLFGNPVILNATDYEQDLVKPLDKYLRSTSLDHGKLVIDEFIVFNKFLESNGVIDKSFLIGKNYGIDRNNKVILIDIGELFTEREEIRKQIQKKPWDHSYVTKTLPRALKKYFVDQMNQNFILIHISL